MSAPGGQDEDANVPYATRREELLNKVIDHEFSEEDMHVVALKIIHAEPVCTLLNITQADWVTLTMDNQGGYNNLKFKMMLKWMRDMGSRATLRNLVIALTRVEELSDISVVEKIVNHFAKSIGSQGVQKSPEYTDNDDRPLPDFSKLKSIGTAFVRLTTSVKALLAKSNFLNLRRAILVQIKTPNGAKLSPASVEKIKDTENLDELLDILVELPYFSWIDLRLLEALVDASGSSTADELLSSYKNAIFSRKLYTVLPSAPSKVIKEKFYGKIVAKVNKKADEITVADLLELQSDLEDVIMDIGKGTCTLDHFKDGCIEIHWHIPNHCAKHAYNSASVKHHKFHELSLHSLQIGVFPIIYDPLTAHLSQPIVSEPQSPISAETDETYNEAILIKSYEKKNIIQADASIMNDDRYETLIEVVNDIEFYTAICQMDEDVQECTKQDDLTKSDTTYYFGTWKSVPVVVVQTGKKVGSQFQYGSWFETKKALYYLKSIKYVFGVGVCGAVLGNDGPRINLGQVAVSSEIVGYDHRKKKTNGDEDRGFHRTSLERKFYHFLTQTPNLHKWTDIVQFGPVLSGSWLVASTEAQKLLMSSRRKEIALEMEGVGIAAACDNTQVECLVVKGVSDYADYDKGDLWQPVAARNAACYLSEMLRLKKQKDQKKNEHNLLI